MNTESVKSQGFRKSIAELAQELEINASALTETIDEFNAACKPGKFNPSILDGVATTGLNPNKTKWALPIDEPPFEAFITTTGVTFTLAG